MMFYVLYKFPFTFTNGFFLIVLWLAMKDPVIMEFRLKMNENGLNVSKR